MMNEADLKIEKVENPVFQEYEEIRKQYGGKQVFMRGVELGGDPHRMLGGIVMYFGKSSVGLKNRLYELKAEMRERGEIDPYDAYMIDYVLPW